MGVSLPAQGLGVERESFCSTLTNQPFWKESSQWNWKCSQDKVNCFIPHWSPSSPPGLTFSEVSNTLPKLYTSVKKKGPLCNTYNELNEIESIKQGRTPRLSPAGEDAMQAEPADLVTETRGEDSR